jgi:hypothetical protein
VPLTLKIKRRFLMDSAASFSEICQGVGKIFEYGILCICQHDQSKTIGVLSLSLSLCPLRSQFTKLFKL